MTARANRNTRAIVREEVRAAIVELVPALLAQARGVPEPEITPQPAPSVVVIPPVTADDGARPVPDAPPPQAAPHAQPPAPHEIARASHEEADAASAPAPDDSPGPDLTTLRPSLRLMLAKLDAAARRGEPCPTNVDLAAMLDCANNTIVPQMQQLERIGAIRVERFMAGREVTIVATGMKTAFHGPRTPHWSTDPERRMARRQATWATQEQRRQGATTAAPKAIVGQLGEAEPEEVVIPPEPPRAANDTRPEAASREACFKCGIRGDLGCAHQRPYVAPVIVKRVRQG